MWREKKKHDGWAKKLPTTRDARVGEKTMHKTHQLDGGIHCEEMRRSFVGGADV